MFWKKSKDKPSSQDFSISFDLDRRHHFRVRPHPERPLVLETGGRKYRLLDISAGGFALAGEGLRNGQTATGALFIPGQDEAVEFTFQVINLKSNGLAAASIESISEGHRELIHQYVLERQKEMLKEKKAETARKQKTK